MAERGNRERETELSELEGVSNVLLFTPSLSQSSTEACLHLLSRASPERTNVLSIAYTESPAEFVARWTEGAGGPPARGGIVAAGEAEASVEDSNWAVRSVENPADLTGVGIELSELLSGMAAAAADDETVSVCFNNLTSLLQYADLQRTFRFLHVVTGRVKTAGGTGHYHIDPDAHDGQTLATLKGLFDAVVEVDGDGTWEIQR
jgi:hypothetical protein